MGVQIANAAFFIMFATPSSDYPLLVCLLSPISNNHHSFITNTINKFSFSARRKGVLAKCKNLVKPSQLNDSSLLPYIVA
jgi:hypothetical protein